MQQSGTQMLEALFRRLELPGLQTQVYIVSPGLARPLELRTHLPSPQMGHEQAAKLMQDKTEFTSLTIQKILNTWWNKAWRVAQKSAVLHIGNSAYHKVVK